MATFLVGHLLLGEGQKVLASICLEEKTIRYGYYLTIFFCPVFFSAAVFFAETSMSLWFLTRLGLVLVSLSLAGFSIILFWIFRQIRREINE